MNVSIQQAGQTMALNRFSVTQEQQNEPLRECVRIALDRYLEQMDGHNVHGIYRMVLDEVEPPMLEAVLRHCAGNQSRAAQMLGMSRSTLRKKLADYALNT